MKLIGVVHRITSRLGRSRPGHRQRQKMKGDVKLKVALDIELMSITGMLVTPRIANNMNE